MPTTSKPCSVSSAAVTELSTPPDMATTTRQSRSGLSTPSAFIQPPPCPPPQGGREELDFPSRKSDSPSPLEGEGWGGGQATDSSPLTRSSCCASPAAA